MSGFGGFGGFGQNNNNQASTGFGGFGSTTNTSTGFGTNTNTGFGSTSNTNGGGLFGGGSTTAFGNSGGAFGNTANSGFGSAAKPPAFGAAATTGGSLFGGGNTTSTSTFGSTGFGSTAPSTSFGTTNTTGGLFGATSSPFGGSATTSAFGAPASTALSQTGAGECQGTASVPFQPFVEKEPNSSTNQQNSFQNITFQQPYQKFSPEELRLADYNQGRRYGNGSNQAGAFGQTNFGGFGSNNTGTTGFGTTNNNTGATMFGAATTNSPFGTNQPATTGFGSNTNTTGGGFFGAKPASGGLFGAQPTTQPGGGLFGNTANTGFGSTNTGGFGNTTNNTGGGLFGSTSTPVKPFSFGNSQPTSTGTGFGTTPATGGFGSGGLFGNNAQQQPAATGFGAQQPAGSNPFGGGFGGNTQQQTGTSSLFGQQAQKPATGGLFGTTPAVTGATSLFGNTQTTNSSNPLGSTQNSGGLFGNKPATTGTAGLFGSTNTQASTGGSLFGNFGTQNQTQNQNQQQSGGLFGSLNNKPATSSLFGNTTQQQGGSGLFGNSGTQQTSSLFGNLNNSNNQQQQQPQSSLFGTNHSLFGNSTQNQQPSQSLTASIGDNAAFGSQSLFSNLASTQVNNPGPIATPLSSSRNSTGPKSTALPLYKLNSASASRFSTPQKRGFGFSYSTYGSPLSAGSTSSTPGVFSGSMLGAGSFGRSLSKSMSTSSLRRSFNTEDSILAPGAFSASPNARHFGSTGNVKKLTISRNIRTDLFSPPAAQAPPAAIPTGGVLKKRVSFDSNNNGNGINTPSPLKQVNTTSPSSTDLGSIRPNPSVNGNMTNGSASQPEMEQISNANNQLAIVREEDIAPVESTAQKHLDDSQPGDYWMSPSKEELQKMNRVQRSKVTGFTVGRTGVGQVRFDLPVDFTSVNIDEVLGNIVKIEVRSVTVYPDNHKKPPMGKGLNLPSTITLQNSWPRKRDHKTPIGDQSGIRLKKHVEKLKKVPDTEFVDYDTKTGAWTFKVPHFTTYEFPDEEENESDDFGQSTLGAPPDSPTPYFRHPAPEYLDQSFASTSQITQSESDPEDTFEFRKSKKVLPGAFDEEEVFQDDAQIEPYEYDLDQQSFLDERSVGSQSENSVKEPDVSSHGDESVSIEDQEMAGSFPDVDNTAGLYDDSQNDVAMDVVAETPGTVTRAKLRGLKHSGTPKKQFVAGDDWTSALQATVSPKKQDRALLKSLVDNDDQTQTGDEYTPKTKRITAEARGFATSIDLMHSLLGMTGSPVKKARAKSKGFEWPYTKRSKTGNYDISQMDEKERSFHNSMKPSWGSSGTLLYAAVSPGKPFEKSSRYSREKNSLLQVQTKAIVSEHRDVRFAKFSNEASAELLHKQKEMTNIDVSDNIPLATLPDKFSFADFFDESNARDHATVHENLVWQLASILWDPINIPVELSEVPGILSLVRKDKLSVFWKRLVEETSTKQVALARSHEEKAIACLAGHRIPDACLHLLNSGDFHLATLIALIGSKEGMRKAMREQLNAWQKSKMLSEFTQPIRTLYELVAGNVCVCDGLKGSHEDRVDSFIISKRFGLDWRQAFGLRLWYGISPTEPLETAIEDFASDLAQSKETSKPIPWYVEHKVPILWHDPGFSYREDLLWGLLKLATFEDSNLEDILRPENSQLSPMDIRLSWQLSRAIISSGCIQFLGDDDDKADHTTLSFASQLTSEGSWLDAVFVLLHLSSPNARAKSIKEHLGHHAGHIGTEDSPAFTTLTKVLMVPAAWLWEAKALYMRSVEKNPKGEVECLLQSGSLNEAHRTFSREVAPQCVIELDYETLQDLLRGFAGKATVISDWQLGGEIYQDYLVLVEAEKEGYQVEDLVLERLLSGLPAIVEEVRHPSFVERVAVETMSATVAKTVLALRKKGEKTKLPMVLRLPLTEDKYLQHSVELSLEYYCDLVASAT